MSLFKSLKRVVKNVVLLPVAVVKDVVTVGGMATGENEPYSVGEARR